METRSDSDSRIPSSLPSSRGAGFNPPNRFEPLHLDRDSTVDISPDDDEQPADHTTYLIDRAATLITYNDSPDVGFDAGINVYRGCEHGCIYCYARPTHEYLGFSAGLDFEQKILVKTDAPNILRKELSASKWKPQVLAMSGVTDPYQPVERRLQLTRQCLEVLAKFRNPVGIITKNQLITRDLDLLKELSQFSAVAVFVSLTTLDPKLRQVMEPRTSPPAARLRTIERLANEGIPVGTLIAPVVPGLTDHEIPKLISAATDAGAQFAGHVVLRLPLEVKTLFAEWLRRHFPQRVDKVLNQIKGMRSGALNSSQFGTRMKGKGVIADQIHQLFQVACRKAGILNQAPNFSTKHFRRDPTQLDLFSR